MRSLILVSSVVSLLFPLAAACSGKTESVGSASDGGADGGGSDAASDGGGLACPAALPVDGAACTSAGLVCGYGDDPRIDCRDRATCAAGAWSVSHPPCAPLPPVTCPASRAAAQGQSCTTKGAWCSYEEGLACECTDCPNPYPLCQPGPLVWACASPNTQPGCPAAIPNLGGSCSPEGTTCTYGCEQGRARVCQGGVWVESSSPGGCPISTRAAKRDVRYLSPAQLDTLAQQVEHMRLATYEYKDPARAGQRHLGFILEDNPVPFGEDAEHNQVDLYGYASTLAAAVQVQNQRIEALEAEVEMLRAQRR